MDEDCDGIVDDVGVGVVVLESAAGLGLTRLREPMAQIEGGTRRGLRSTVGLSWSRCRSAVVLLSCCLAAASCPPERGGRGSLQLARAVGCPRLYVIRPLGCTTRNHFDPSQALQTRLLAGRQHQNKTFSSCFNVQGVRLFRIAIFLEQNSVFPTLKPASLGPEYLQSEHVLSS